MPYFWLWLVCLKLLAFILQKKFFYQPMVCLFGYRLFSLWLYTIFLSVAFLFFGFIMLFVCVVLSTFVGFFLTYGRTNSMGTLFIMMFSLLYLVFLFYFYLVIILGRLGHRKWNKFCVFYF